MMKKTLGTLILVIVLVSSLALPVAAKKNKAPRSQVVGSDPAGDWAGEPQLGPVGEQLGQDLVSASLGTKAPDLLVFTMKVTSLPADFAQWSSYSWAFTIQHALRKGSTVASDEGSWVLSSSTCESTSSPCSPSEAKFGFTIQACPPVKDDTALSTNICTTKGWVEAGLDLGKGEIVAEVPLDVIGAVPGDRIAPSASDVRRSVVAEVSQSFSINEFGTPNDFLVVDRYFTIK